MLLNFKRNKLANKNKVYLHLKDPDSHMREKVRYQTQASLRRSYEHLS